MINWVNIAVLIPFLILIGVICLVVGSGMILRT